MFPSCAGLQFRVEWVAATTQSADFIEEVRWPANKANHLLQILKYAIHARLKTAIGVNPIAPKVWEINPNCPTMLTP